MIINKKHSFAIFAAAVLLAASVSVLAQRGRGAGSAGPANPAIGNQQAIQEGEAIYSQTCTVCHGKDGAAGEMAPAVAAPSRRYNRATDDAVFDAIKNGIPQTQMAPFKTQFSDDQIWKIVAYIHGLRGTAIDAPTQGNAANGEQIFWAKGQCGSCHMIRGKGSLIGPDLSDIAGIRKTQSIVNALTKPIHRIPGDGGTHDSVLMPLQSYQPVRVTLADGKVINGVLRNEDSFSLQVFGTDNQLYLFDRSKLKEVYYQPKSLMPTDYDKRLTPEEFQDLLAFLTRQHVVPLPPLPGGRGGGPPAA
jgi:putative heme-binding domain-containing protein